MAATNKWVRKVKTVSTFPPAKVFTKDAATIARVMASRTVSPKGLGSGIRMIQYFINRGGKGLSASRRRALERAKRLLQSAPRATGPSGAPDGPPRATRSLTMPEKRTIERARAAKRGGRRRAAGEQSPSTQAGEFVHEEIEHIRQGKHGARSTKQAIAIGLSEARRAGVKLPPPPKGSTSTETRRRAARDYRAGQRGARTVNPRRARATTRALEREGRGAVSHAALSRQARQQAARRSPRKRSAIARKAARTRARRSG
jgi:hypothetical protein